MTESMHFADRIQTVHGMPIHLRTEGQGRPVLVLHGGGGPVSVANLVSRLAENWQVFQPTHPGFALTERPHDLDSVSKLAELYLAMLDALNLDDVVVVGCSMGGWIAAEMAARDTQRLSRLVLVNAVGMAVPGEVVVDVFTLQPHELAALSYHDPAKAIFPAVLTPELKAIMASNFAALAAYGKEMQDPDLAPRLSKVALPVLVAWGESDRIVSTAYGRAYAAAFSNSQFVPISQCGHMPQIEALEPLMAALAPFIPA